MEMVKVKNTKFRRTLFQTYLSISPSIENYNGIKKVVDEEIKPIMHPIRMFTNS
jgi:hypothetical protein